MQYVVLLLSLVINGLVFVVALSNAVQQSTLLRLSDTRIVGGREVHISVYPHQISLRFKNIFFHEFPYFHRCGGSIIRDNVVLTAAHCVLGTVARQFEVVAGTNNRLGSDGTVVRVKQIIQHDNYNSDTYNNDIAMLILDPPLPLNNFTIKSIDLAQEDFKNGVKAVVTGWGATSEGGIAANRLHAVEVPIVSNHICNEDYSGQITDSMLCAGWRGVGGKDACQGDSGGPLVVRGKLTGVVSWGYGCARPEYPGVYAKILYLLPWIRKNIAEYA